MTGPPPPAVQKLGRQLSGSHQAFVKFAFEQLGGGRYLPTPYDAFVCSVVDRVFSSGPDRITRLIVNIPPRYGKTLRFVVALVARGYAINAASNFIHVSYSQELVHKNSIEIRDVINSLDYRRLYPHVEFRSDVSARGLWRTSAGGTFLAAPAGGGITGHGAGILGESGFSGALIVDDPTKPDDARSDTVMAQVNSRWASTLRSRLANPDTPVIVIQQRVSDSDFTNELLNESGANEDWHHVVLPAYIDADYQYEQTGLYIPHGLPPGTLWGHRFNDEGAMMAMNDVQYSQSPTPLVGEVYQREWFGRYHDLPANIKGWSIYCDTASKTGKYNDWSVFQLWAKTTRNQGYLAAIWRKKVQIPFLKESLTDFYDQAIAMSGMRSKSNDIMINIEDKDSGVGLIQAMKLDGYPIKPIQRFTSKYARAIDAADHVRKGDIFIPATTEGDLLVNEAVSFMADDSHAHDDMIDPMNDFINFELPKVGAHFGFTTGVHG